MDYTFSDLIGLTPERMLRALNGYYECPFRELPGGKVEWLGPLAGYTSKDALGRQRLGPQYVNFDVIRNYEPALAVTAQWFMQAALDASRERISFKQRFGFCGIPTGGKAIVEKIRCRSTYRCICPEKVEVGVGSSTARAGRKLWFPPGQEPQPGEWLILCEDVGNAFSTTAEMIELIESYGAVVVVILVYLNRSSSVKDVFVYKGRSLPVIALWHKPMPIYEMDNPVVCEAVATGNYVLKPKDEWSRLTRIMAEYAQHKDLVPY